MVCPMSDLEVEGHVSVHPRGFGFLAVHDHGAATDSAFIAPPDLNPFLHGDRVRATVVAQKDGRFKAVNLHLLERKRDRLFGTVIHRHGTPHLKTDRRVANTDWRLENADEFPAGAEIVARVEAEYAVALEEVKGADSHLERLYVRFGIRPRFPHAVQAEVAALAEPDLLEGRRDLRDLPTLTIDADTSMDLDDALSALPAAPDGAIRVFVHIADVDSAVTEGSALDEEARARGTSVYLDGAVIPMLPRVLSEDRLSLLPERERPALTVELRIDSEGETTSVDVYPSVIRSDQRFSYETVAAFLEHGKTETIPSVLQETLRWLRSVSARIAVVRAGRGGIEIEREEASIVVDEHTKEPTEVVARKDDSAHLLIERMMVAANEAVARWLVDRGLPGVFRVHPEPDARRVEALIDSARTLGFEAGLSSPVTPKAMAAFEVQFRHTAAQPTLSKIVSRVLGPASYTVEPGLHFGLAAPLYLHFTSPIRRYADLSVHRIIKAFLAGQRDMFAGDERIEALARHLTDRTIQANKAERERFSSLAARFFATKVGDRHAGRVVAVKTFGLVVQLVGSGVTGTLATDDLPGGPWTVDRSRQRLKGPRRTIQLGDEMAVEIANADEAVGRIELKPISNEG